MMGVVFRSILVIALAAAATAASAQPKESEDAGTDQSGPTNEVTDRDRMWNNFTREAATVGDNHFWVELRGMLFQKNDPRIALNGYAVKPFEQKVNREMDELDGGRFDLIGAYGLGDAELGTDLPIVMQQQFDYTDGTFADHAAFGDMVLYGKFRRQIADHWAGALGLEMSIPTGDSDVLLGSGDLGLNPFVSTRYQSGRLAIGGHLGFLFNAGSQPQVFNYSIQGIARLNATLAARVEVSGRFFKDVGNEFNDIAAYPGLDFNLTENFIIRPEGMAGLAYQAFDWGIGIGFVFTM